MLDLGWHVAFLSLQSGELLSTAECGLLVVGAPRCGAPALGRVGSAWQLRGSQAQAWQLWPMGLVALWYVGSSQIRDQTHVFCVGKWILYRWATREAQSLTFFHSTDIYLVFAVFQELLQMLGIYQWTLAERQTVNITNKLYRVLEGDKCRKKYIYSFIK